MKAEIKVMNPPDKEHQRLTANHQKLGQRRRTDSPLQLSEGTNTEETLISDV